MYRALNALLVLAFFTSACLFGGLSEEDQKRLTLFQQNAQLYYDGERFDQALDAAGKGLELDSDDYKLLSLSGHCYLRLGNLRKADEFFTRVYSLRRPQDHRGHVLLGYGRTKQLLGNEHARLAQAEISRSERTDLTETERTLALTRSQEHSSRAAGHWDEAARLYRELVDREELLRFAYKGLMEIEVERGNYDESVAYGEACLVRNTAEQDVKEAIIRETESLDHERFERQQLDALVEQELRVRSALAEMHYRQGDFAASIKQLDVLLEHDPTRSTDYYNRARAYENLKQLDDARRDYEKFLGTTKLPNGDERVAHAFNYISDRV